MIDLYDKHFKILLKYKTDTTFTKNSFIQGFKIK